MAITWKDFDINNVIFEKVTKMTTTAEIKFQRIFLKYKYHDGTVGKISIRTPKLYSYGVQENRSSQTNLLDSYTLPVTMYDKMVGQTEDEAKTIEMLESCLKLIKQHLKKSDVKEALNKYEMDADVDQMDIFYRKKDKGLILPDIPPTLYPKLVTAYEKSRNPSVPPKIVTGFYDSDDEPIDPIALINERCRVVCDVCLDNIYIGAKPSIQVKVNDVIVVDRFTRRRRLFGGTDEKDE